ncbi:MAG: right-handed parallel beta-helix repeat-containing protein [Candidatus Bathyarchaeota archaeon]|nr:right-handed parallel beta-helix repeat-containing protein [Candidatus Bathyarchaeota archaeon]
MRRSLLSTLVMYFLLSSIICYTVALIEAEESPKFSISRVPQDFETIQKAVNNSTVGDTIFVSSGLYYEHVIVNKTVTLTGENRQTTIVDGSNGGTVIRVTANNVRISGFKLQNSGWKWGWSGVEVYQADNCIIQDNFIYRTCHQIRLNGSRSTLILGNIISAPSTTVPQSAYGVRLENSTDCVVKNNLISNHIGGVHLENSANCTVTGNTIIQNGQGIRLYTPCVNNTMVKNTVYNNSYEGMIEEIPPNQTLIGNRFIHNNFINNSNPFIYETGGCIWDDGLEGNFWTTYQGKDLNSDGIGDSPHVIGADRDNHPLMGRFSEFETTLDHEVQTISNSTISDFQFNSSSINFSAYGVTGTASFCRITIPLALMNGTFRVLVNGTQVPHTLLEATNSTHSHLYFTYDQSIKDVIVIPEFASIILAIAMLVALLPITLCDHVKRKTNLSMDVP